VRNDRKRAPARNLVGQGAHQLASAIAGIRAVSGERSRCAGTGDGYDGYMAFANWNCISGWGRLGYREPQSKSYRLLQSVAH
jgi:hypothetical protein